MIFYSDFDDTLYFHDGRGLRKEDVEAIRSFQEEGNTFVLCTGRPISMRKAIQEKIEGKIRFDYEIYSCGSVIADRDGNPIDKTAIAKDAVKEILKTFDQENLMIHHEKGLFYTRQVKEEPGVLEENPLKLLDGEFYEISISLHEADQETVTARLSQIDRISCYFNRNVLDIVSSGVSKGTAVLKLDRLLNVSVLDTAAMGDSFNDVEMLKAVEQSFTFPQSVQEVKNVSEHLACSVQEALSVLNATEN